MTAIPETRPSLLLKMRDTRNQQAWTEFLEIYQPLIHRLIRKSGIQEADAGEVTQEVLLTVSGAIDRWDSDPAKGTFRGWLSTITRNLVVNFLVRQSRHPRGRGDTDFNRWMRERPASEGEMSLLFDLEQQRRILRWAAEQIRSEFHETTWHAFWLTSVENREVADVAVELGITPGIVCVSRSRVMKRLRVKVQQARMDD